MNPKCPILFKKNVTKNGGSQFSELKKGGHFCDSIWYLNSNRCVVKTAISGDILHKFCHFFILTELPTAVSDGIGAVMGQPLLAFFFCEYLNSKMWFHIKPYIVSS